MKDPPGPKTSGKCILVKMGLQEEDKREAEPCAPLGMGKQHLQALWQLSQLRQTLKCWAVHRGSWSTQVTDSEHQPWGQSVLITPMSYKHTGREYTAESESNKGFGLKNTGNDHG